MVEQGGCLLENGYIVLMLELVRGHKLGIHDNSHFRINDCFHFRCIGGIDWYNGDECGGVTCQLA